MDRTGLWNRVKTALRVRSSAFDEEIGGLIRAAYVDLKRSGIDPERKDESDLIALAIIIFCRLHFGEPANSDILTRRYEHLKAFLALGGDPDG